MAVYNRNKDALPVLYAPQKKEVFVGYDIDSNIIHTTPNDTDPESGRRIIFFDDFDGDALNTDNWRYEIGPVRPNNNELQFYRSLNNVSVHDSMLHLKAKKEDYRGKTWTSGSITSQRLKSFRYGRMEAKIKFPKITGAFCAFWMLGNYLTVYYCDEYEGDTNKTYDGGWPECGEIDITETIPGTSVNGISNMWSYYGQSLGGRSGGANTEGFHIYACERTKDYIAMSFDGVEYGRYTFGNFSDDKIQAYIDQYFYLILNFAVGGAGGTPASDCTEMDMYVDWVKVLAPLE